MKLFCTFSTASSNPTLWAPSISWIIFYWHSAIYLPQFSLWSIHFTRLSSLLGSWYSRMNFQYIGCIIISLSNHWIFFILPSTVIVEERVYGANSLEDISRNLCSSNSRIAVMGYSLFSCLDRIFMSLVNATLC